MLTAARQFGLQTPTLAIATALILLAVGFLGAFLGERDFREQKMDQVEAHARVLGASVSAALAFHDNEEARHSVQSLSADPDIGAIGVYTEDGALFLGRRGPRGDPPARIGPRPTRYANGYATTVAHVQQEGVPLGFVYVELSAGSGASRWIRYVGLALLAVMAALMVAVTATAQRELAERAEALARTNEQLGAEVKERRKAQTALAQAQKMEAIGQLTGGVAHDFNNLLMVVSSGLRLLETREDQQTRASIVEAMRQAVDRGAGLTKQLLAFSRRQRLTPEVVLLRERLQSLLPLLERSLREDIKVQLQFDDPDAIVKVDPGQLDLGILNMAVNARDAMPSGGVLLLSVAETPGDAGSVTISVSDNGVGMTEEVRSRAFDPFFTTKEVGRGTGLGLSQVYGFALQSGGNCDIESAPGQGTIVRLTLPRTSEPLPAPVEQRTKDVSGAGTVLVVEDDDNVAAMVCEMIRDLGYNAMRVADAKAALAHLSAEPPVDVVFSDIIMPGGMSGIELAQELKQLYPDLPVLLTTGYGGRNEFDAQGFAVLRKPYDRDQLGAALSSAV